MGDSSVSGPIPVQPGARVVRRPVAMRLNAQCMAYLGRVAS